MAAQKIVEIRAMRSDELNQEVARLKRHIFDLRAQAVTEKLENPHLIGDTRKTIARMLTVLRERVAAV